MEPGELQHLGQRCDLCMCLFPELPHTRFTGKRESN